MTTEEMTARIVTTLDKRLATDICVLEVGELTSVAERFVICSGNSASQTKALADYVEEAMKEQGVSPLREEGYATAQWVLMDYGSVVLHIFQQNTRTFYDLEHLWADATALPIAQYINCEES